LIRDEARLFHAAQPLAAGDSGFRRAVVLEPVVRSARPRPFGSMTNARLIRGLLLAALILVLAAGYFSTIGHCFLPHRNPETFLGEQLEVRTFSGFVIPDRSKTLAGLFARIKWRLLRPGQVRLLAAAEKIEQEKPGADHVLKTALEQLGYGFPSGCYARSGDNLPMEITHYPSALNRIQKDLHLDVSWRSLIGPDGNPLPNKDAR
jgi:hypothetical protein